MFDSEGHVSEDEARARAAEVVRLVDVHRDEIEDELGRFDLVELPNGVVLLDGDEVCALARRSSFDADARLVLDVDAVEEAEGCLGCGWDEYWPICPSCAPMTRTA